MPKIKKRNSHYLGGVFLRVPKEGTPLAAVAPTATLTFGGAVKHGDEITVGTDKYRFTVISDEVSNGEELAVDISTYTTKASGTLTLADNPVAGDTITVGEETYEFVTEAEELTDIEIGEAVADTQENVVEKLNEHDDIVCGDFEEGVATITAIAGGTAGNEIATTSEFTSTNNKFGALTLTGGTDCSAANAKTAFLAVEEKDFYTKESGAGQTVKLTGTVKGTLLERIKCSTTGANITFSKPNLSGGVDSVPGKKGDMMFDKNKLYILTKDQELDGTNWKSIAFS